MAIAQYLQPRQLNLAPSSQLLEAAIVAENISMTLQSPEGRVPILNNINLRVERGQVHLLMGPSGAGKTTLLLILSALMSPTSGHVSLLGENITHLSKRYKERFRLQNIGFIAQDFNLFPALTATENVLFALWLKGIRGQLANHRAQELLAQAGLADQANHLPRQLSGGQQQRVAIARALANQPQLIMADEPTASLDAQNGQMIMGLLRNLAQEQGCTLLMVTHDPRIINANDQITYIEDGQIKIPYNH